MAKQMKAKTAHHGEERVSDYTHRRVMEKGPKGRRVPIPIRTETRYLHYRFFTHFHPYVQALVKQLIERGVSGLQATDTQFKTIPDGKPKAADYLLYEEFFKAAYDPSDVFTSPDEYPVK